MFKIMLDTNVLDFIFNNNLLDLVKQLNTKKLISLYITHIQKDQIEAISDHNKKQALQSIPVNQILLSVGWVAGENEKGGFKGPRVNHFKVVDDNDAKIMEECLQDRTKRSQRIFSDMGIIYTAIKEDMHYIVSADRDMKQFYECLKEKMSNNLKFQTMEEFSLFLYSLAKNNQ